MSGAKLACHVDPIKHSDEIKMSKVATILKTSLA
jgi:hypothetical protein